VGVTTADPINRRLLSKLYAPEAEAVKRKEEKPGRVEAGDKDGKGIRR
jgi:hypothetical protein